MNLENKTIGIVFINNLKIKDNLIYELKKLKAIKNVTIIPIMKLDNLNNKLNYNIEVISKITENKPFFYNKSIIPKKIIKSFDILILVGCSGNVIYKLSINEFNSNILKMVKIHKIENKPVVIGINIKDSNFLFFKHIDKLYRKKGYYFIPFKIANPITKPNTWVFEPSFFMKTVSLSLKEIQIKPIISFL